MTPTALAELALRRVQHYVAMRRAKPFLGLGDSIHCIHTGTEWEAELTFSDMSAIADHGAALLSSHAALRTENEELRAALESIVNGIRKASGAWEWINDDRTINAFATARALIAKHPPDTAKETDHAV